MTGNGARGGDDTPRNIKKIFHSEFDRSLKRTRHVGRRGRRGIL